MDAVTLDLSKAQPLPAAPVQLDMSKAQPLPQAEDTRSLWQKAKDNFNAATQGAKPGDGAVKSFVENVGAGGGDVVRALAHPIDTISSMVSTPDPMLRHFSGDKDAVTQEAKSMPGVARTIGQVGTGTIIGEAGGAALRAVPKVTRAISDTTGAAIDAVKSKLAGPQPDVMPSAAKLPLIAQSGVEDIFRAAAPTSKNAGFRENLNVVAPDLADIARKVDISEAKGGIINPDMRVRATVDAIRDHLNDMAQNERVPQIERNAQSVVKVGTNPNAVRGLEYLESTAGDVEDSLLARKALDGGTINVAEADKLAKVANQTLLSYERATPEAKMQLQTANPKIGGLKALDSDLTDNLNGVLQSNGEKGLYSYERRYAGLSAVLDQLQSRMNATELKQQGVFGTVGQITRPILKLVKEGPSGVPSASQAAVSDVNIGRTLQNGLKKLKSSGITAYDPTQYPTPRSRPPMLLLPDQSGAKIPLMAPDPGMSAGERSAALNQWLRQRQQLALPAQSTPIR